MKLNELLKTMQDLNLEVHYYKNHSLKLDSEHKPIPCKEIGVETGSDSSIITRHYMQKRDIAKIDLSKCEVFYIGFTTSRSRTLRINVEVLD